MTNLQTITPVVLCGGLGSRLWPVSRKSFPKQFVELVNGNNLFELTLQRVIEGSFAEPLIVASEHHRFHVSKQVTGLGLQCDILLEPSRRNTAPAIIMAALHLQSQGYDGQMLVLPSDHLIPDVDAFCDAVMSGVSNAQQGKLVTFGIMPTRPDTGYGYIQSTDSEGAVRGVTQFHEKPNLELATEMLSLGGYFWNAGIFLVKVSTIIELAEEHQPEMFVATKNAAAAMRRDGLFLRPDEVSWSTIPANSIDYAILEKSNSVVCVPFSGLWSDLGDWNSVFALGTADNNGNRLRGAATAIDCINSKFWSTNEQTQLVGLGLDGIIAVATKDAIFVANAERSQDVGKVVESLETAKITQAHQHMKDYRPWGWFERLVTSPNYQVKLLYVEPGARLSLQSHRYRSEHWIVVSGTATVVVNQSETQVNTNESIYINVGDRHRLANDTCEPLKVIEVQTGSYLGEDDIVRHQDDFSRN